MLRTSEHLKTFILDLIARNISKSINPLTASVLALLFASIAGSNNPGQFFSYVSIILFFTIIIPLVYIYIKSSTRLVKGGQIQNPLGFFRGRRKDIIIIGIVSAVPCIVILGLIGAPRLLVATISCLLAICLAVGLLNFLYKASFHLSLVTLLVIVIVVAWRQAFPYAIGIIILVGWARFWLQQHGVGQLVAGFGISSFVSVGILYLFGLT